MMDQYIVWYKLNDGWWPSKPTTKKIADALAKAMEADGVQFVIARKPSNTVRELYEEALA